MEITSQGSTNVSEGGAYRSLDESECVTNQPMANGMLPNPYPYPYPYHTEESPPCSDRLEEGDSSDEGLMDNTLPDDDDIARLLPSCTPSSRPSKNKDSISEDRVLPPAVCTPPSPSIPPSPHPLPLSPSECPDGSVTSSSPPLQSTPCHRHLPHHHLHRQGTNQKRLSSGAKSHASLKTDSAHHIKEVARDDCCAHCVLACLFCEVLSMCSVLGDCLACGGSGIVCCDAAGCCCCCAEAVGGMACTEEACQAVLDCGIMEDCCGSSDCMEICLECCSICFPT